MSGSSTRLFHVSFVFLVSALLAVLVTAESRGEVIDTFDSDSADWLVVRYPFRSHVAEPDTHAVTYSADFGNPPGSIWVGDEYSETGVAAPTRYLGDKSTYYGGALLYDIFIRYTDGVDYPAVVINAGDMSIYYDAPSPQTESWESRSVPLYEVGWLVSGTDEELDSSQFLDVLSDIHGLYIYTEWRTGPDDTNVDNVYMMVTGTTEVGSPQIHSWIVTRFTSWPNPFNPQTTVTLELSQTATVSIGIYDLTGRKISDQANNEIHTAGAHHFTWNGCDSQDRAMPSGTYIVRLETESGVEARKVMLVR